MKQGFALLCVAYPTSDATIQTHQMSVGWAGGDCQRSAGGCRCAAVSPASPLPFAFALRLRAPSHAVPPAPPRPWHEEALY